MRPSSGTLHAICFNCSSTLNCDRRDPVRKYEGCVSFVFQLKAFLVRGLVVEVSAASPFPTFWLLSTTTARVLQGTSPDCMDCNCWLLELRSSS
jgi:hypothetical protein